jgi:Ca2+-binding RTX toxin-like protein
MAEVKQNSAAPKTANATETIHSMRDAAIKPDTLRQAHDFELASAPDDRYDLAYPGSVPPDVDSITFDERQAAPSGDGAPPPAPIQDGRLPEAGETPAASNDTKAFGASEESASSVPATNSARANPSGGSSDASPASIPQPAGPAASEKAGGEPISFASFSADQVSQMAAPTASAEQADEPAQLQPGGSAPAPQQEDGAPPPSIANEAPTALEAELSPIAENSQGGPVVGHLTTLDPDSQESHSYEIVGGHPLFEIDGDTITLKAGAQLDYESRSSYDLEIRSTDGAGNSIIKTVTVNVTDVNEAPTASAIGDHTASAGDAFTLDTSSHFADVDHGDTLTYSVSGPEWVSIDPDTGTISGTPPAHLAAHELTTHANGGYDLPQSGVIQIDAGVTFSESGYSNTLGYYLADAEGKPLGGIIVENNAHELGGSTTLIDLADYPGAAALGFFIIPNGAQNGGLADGQKVEFSFENGQWHASADGAVLHGAGADVFFSNPTLNADGVDHLGGNGNWEDLVGGGDRDYQDVIADVSVKTILAEPSDAHAQITVTVTDSGGLTAHSSFDLNVQPSPVTMDEIEHHTYDPTGSAVNAGPTDIHPGGGNAVENAGAGTVVGRLGSTDANLSDSHSYEIVGGHPLFEVDGDTITLKAGAQLDFETQHSYDLDIRSTDGAGNSIVKTVTVNVTDVNEAPDAAGIGDQTATAGGSFSLDTSSHFSDVDHGDSLTYSIDGPAWLHIDPATGVITGTPPGHMAVQELSAHGNGNYDVPASGVLQLSGHVLSSNAGYQNSVGYYLADASGNPIGGAVFEDNAHNLGESIAQIDMGEYPGATTLGFFIIPNGNQNAASADGQKVEFQFSDGQWHASANGTQLAGTGAGVFFSDATLNAHGLDYVVDNSAAGNLNWEDLVGGGDGDFDDVNAQVSLTAVQLVPDSPGGTVTVTVTDSGGLTAQSSFDLNIEPGAVALADQPDPYSVTGTEHSESIYGTEHGDSVSGLGGTDLIHGYGGDDIILGGDGNDLLYGDAGDDALDGGDGNDIVSGGAGNDVAYLGTGDDVFDTTNGDRDDGDGADTVYGDGGNDHIWGGGSDDKLHGGDGNDYVNGETGNDSLYGDAGDDLLDGDIGNDCIDGGAGADQLYGGAGNDTLIVDANDTLVQGGDGSDKVVVSSGDGVTLDLAASSIERAEGGGGNDIFNASSATAAVTEYGNAGDDTLTGGAGNDYLDGGTGNDHLIGGAGNDTFYAGDGNDVVSGGDGTDVAHLGAGDDTFDTTYGAADDGDGADTVYGDDGNDLVYGGGSGDSLDGGTGNDRLYGEAGDDKVYGNAGDDTLDGGDGNDTLYGGDGNDSLTGGDGNDVVSGGAGDDIARLGAGDDVFDTTNGSADDGDGADTVYGDGGSDTIYGGGGNDLLHGGDGNDHLYGEAGNDTLFGSAGDDIIFGMGGTDTMIGEDGSDLFMFGTDSGMDIANGGAGGGWIDTVQLSGANGMGTPGVFGTDWTMQLTSGQILAQDEHQITLSQDADGFIVFDNSHQLCFTDLERIAC